MTLRLSPLVEKAMAGALEHKEEYEKMMVNLAGAAAGEFYPKIILTDG